MKAMLFCINPYAFGILKPLNDELTGKGHDVIWFVPDRLSSQFPFHGEVKQTSRVEMLHSFRSDAIFVPGNEVPHYLRGVKVQVFHGLAGEKKGHFRIRNYFDLYLTQGPYFTERFIELSRKHKDFEVKETGWCKLDPLYRNHPEYLKEKEDLLLEHKRMKLVLFAPTFSPSLTCATEAKESIFKLATRKDILILIKFHDLMNPQIVEEYRQLASATDNVIVVSDRNILKYLVMSDIMISDTSSVVYEFILLNKPVITINSRSSHISWCNIDDANQLHSSFTEELLKDSFRNVRRNIIEQYHPYTDGRSSARMISAVEEYIGLNGVPERRKMNIYRKYLMNKMFGHEPR